uniref:Uncharacterized protein n=1 Tax=Anguilla anguilla TaxID=7936 RepID=A0A0E9UL54_ANGAN
MQRIYNKVLNVTTFISILLIDPKPGDYV